MKGIIYFLLLVSFSALHSQPVTLRDTTNQFDYIIITVSEFVNACEPFRQHKETVRDFRTLIVDTTQIFAEFDSSATPQDNIRDFISYAGTFWKEPKPKYFLIAGTVNDVPNFLILFPGSPDSIYFNSDYYYSQNIYENDSTTTEFYIGRVPGNNPTELENYFSKVINYENDAMLYSWMNNSLFLCEDDTNYGFLEGAFSLASELPSFIRSHFISENDTSQYYGNLDSIYNAINNTGSAVVWFIGHANDSVFAYSHMLDIEDLSGFSNYQKYFFTFFIGRQSAIIDSNTNLTKEMMVMSNAGSLGGSVFVGWTYWGTGLTLHRLWAQRIFNPSIQSLGEVFALDNLVPTGGIYSYMKKITNLWADPSLKLKYDITLDVDDKTDENLPGQFALFQNYPNPFNPSTTIKFALPLDSKVKINIYNSLGQLVEILVDGEMQSGYHEVNFDASRLTSGVYFYQLQTDNKIFAKKMLLIK
jgi:hypothetical protein